MNTSKEFNNNIFERYKMLVHARNFHYENFNKWLTYFYVATSAIFIGYIQVLVSEPFPHKNEIIVFILLLGYVTGIFLYWSSKGYYFWNINFIMLVNHYEKKVLGWDKENSIYSVFGDKSAQNKYWSPISGANFSTSKIAILFAYIISISWGTVLVSKLSNNWCSEDDKYLLLSLGVSILITFFLSILLFKKEKSDNLELQSLMKKEKQHFLWSNTMPLDDLKLEQDKPRIANQNIIMGNDEFIHYIRKIHPNCTLKNNYLGKQIWLWLEDKGAVKIEEDKECKWGSKAKNVKEDILPKTATQFQFKRNLLPELYVYLDKLASEN